MALKATIRRAVKSAFLALDDIPRKATYLSKNGAPVRDLDAGTYTVPTTSIALKMVAFVRFTQKEADKDPAVVLTDQKALIPTEDLGGVVPKSTDSMLDDQGTNWEIIRLMSDPAAAVTILQVRTS